MSWMHPLWVSQLLPYAYTISGTGMPASSHSEGAPAYPPGGDGTRASHLSRAAASQFPAALEEGWPFRPSEPGCRLSRMSLLVLDLTHGSALALGGGFAGTGTRFPAVRHGRGSVADRFDKRRLLLVTQGLMMGLAVLLGVLTATGVIRFWMIPLLAFAGSATLSFDQPARNALATSLVPKEHLMNAVSLQSAVFNGASILGPALAGVTLSRLGYSGNFFLNAASFLAVLAASLLLRTPNVAGDSQAGRGSLVGFRARGAPLCDGTMRCCHRWFRPTRRCYFWVRRWH